MTKINQHIEIVSSTIMELSSMSRLSRDSVLAVLKNQYSNVRITMVNSIEDLGALVERKPDLVFLGMKFIPDNTRRGLLGDGKIWISQYLDEYQITHTGSGQVAHELELNKNLAKQRVAEAGLDTSNYHVAERHQPHNLGDMTLRYPVFIKPTDRGGGEGIDRLSVAHNFIEASSKVHSINTDHFSDALIEEYLPGREFSVAILGNGLEGYSVMPIELVAQPDEHGRRMLSNEVKLSNQEVVLEVTDADVRYAVCTLALAVFHALGARDYGRIDIRLDERGVPHFLEANLLPSLIDGYGSFPKACMLNRKLAYEPMILSIVSMAFSRKLSTSITLPDQDLDYTSLLPQLA